MKAEPNVPLKSWLFLALITAGSLFSYQQRMAIAYVFAYKDPTFDPYFTLAADYPQLESLYGVLANFALDLPYCAIGFIAGPLADQITSGKQRAMIYASVSIAWSFATFGSGYFDAFWAFAIGRMLQGALMSFNSPFGYALIDNWFPNNSKGTATSVLNSAIYIGSGLSSLNVIMTQNYGWRADFEAQGVAGIVVGLLCFLFLTNN